MISGINIQNYSKISSQKRNFKQKKKFLKTYELDQGKKNFQLLKLSNIMVIYILKLKIFSKLFMNCLIWLNINKLTYYYWMKFQIIF